MGIDSKMKIGIVGSLFVVAMVIDVTVSANKHEVEYISTTTHTGFLGKSTVKILCGATDYKNACEESLSSANTTDFKELMGWALRAAEKTIGKALKNSTLLQKTAKDPRTKEAFKVCQEVLENSIEDLHRSVDKLGASSGSEKGVGKYLADIKTWISGAITHQDTCIDAFDNTTGDNGEKMKQMLKSANQLSSNGLAMITDLNSILSSLNFGSFGFSRRLLTDEDLPEGQGDPNVDASSDQIYTEDSESYDPSFVDSKARRLMHYATPAAMKPNAVVAQDGSGQFKTIYAAINSVQNNNNNNKTFVIHVKAGVYKEYVTIPKKVNNIVLVGDGPLKTIITGNKNYADGVATFHTATLVVEGENFLAKDIAIENTAGAEKHQAVAVRVSGDKSIFYNVHMNGYQDTLYAHNYRQFYRNCLISGTIDFIFGDALSIFQNCSLVVRKPMQNQACMVTAQGRKDRRGMGAIVIQNCHITADKLFLAAKPAIKAYLGRPWKEFSRTIIMRTNIDGFIAPEGWSPWMGTFALNTLYYGEFENKGPGCPLTRRVLWKGIQKINSIIAQKFTPGVAFEGDEWIKVAKIPYNPGMY